MPLQKKPSPIATTFYTDFGHALGLRKTQQTRKFRNPRVYSNPLGD